MAYVKPIASYLQLKLQQGNPRPVKKDEKRWNSWDVSTMIQLIYNCLNTVETCAQMSDLCDFNLSILHYGLDERSWRQVQYRWFR